jgi:hypothetical protein
MTTSPTGILLLSTIRLLVSFGDTLNYRCLVRPDCAVEGDFRTSNCGNWDVQCDVPSGEHCAALLELQSRLYRKPIQAVR